MAIVSGNERSFIPNSEVDQKVKNEYGKGGEPDALRFTFPGV
jgi:hypothetical protein